MHLLGKYYEIGYAVQADLEEALKWFSQAAGKGHKEAVQDKARLAKLLHKNASSSNTNFSNSNPQTSPSSKK